MDTSEKEEVQVAPRRDFSEYHNWVDCLESWKKAEAVLTEALEALPAREKAAREMLSFVDAAPSDRQKAEQVLAECSRKRAKFEAPDGRQSLAGTRRLIEVYEKRVAALRPEFEKHEERKRLTARMRGEL